MHQSQTSATDFPTHGAYNGESSSRLARVQENIMFCRLNNLVIALDVANGDCCAARTRITIRKVPACPIGLLDGAFAELHLDSTWVSSIRD